MTSRFENVNGVMIDRITGERPTAEQLAACDATMDAILKAESAFELALRAKYKSRACEMRYQTTNLPADIKALALAYQAAVAAWRATWEVAA